MTPPPDYKNLPVPVRLEDVVAEIDVRPAPDPDGGTNPETMLVIRNAG